MKIYQFSADEALANLNSRHGGLSQAEAKHRLEEYGSNEVEAVRGEAPISLRDSLKPGFDMAYKI
jgi:magnesium-transporting ATPase (P-type)